MIKNKLNSETRKDWRFYPPGRIGNSFVSRCPECGCDQEISIEYQEGCRVLAETDQNQRRTVNCKSCNEELFFITDSGLIKGWVQ